jgi:CrcB protein
MIKDLLFVGIGGFLGSILRYLVNIRLLNFNVSFPWATLTINLSGSLLIGILMALWIKDHNIWKLLLITGFCGGFTTFSTFSYENLVLWKTGHEQAALLYMVTSLIGGILCVFIGFLITQKVIQ